MLHLAALTATIMTANVFLIIMPNQRIVVADRRAGRRPEARSGQITKPITLTFPCLSSF